MPNLQWSVFIFLLYFYKTLTLRSTPDQFATANLIKFGTGTQLEVTRTRLPQNGLPLVMRCTIQKSIQSCNWTSPKYQNLRVENGQVLDGTGKSSDWAEVWTGDNPQNTCGIRIPEMTDEDSGDWKCKLEDRDKFLIEGIITTQAEASTNMRLANEITPLGYKLYLSPDLLADVDYAPFSGVMTMDLKVYNSGSAMNYVMFHSEELHIKQITLKKLTEKGKVDDEVMISGIGFDYWRTFVYVYSDTLLKGNYRLNVVYDSMSKAPADEIGPSGYAGLYKVPCLYENRNLNTMNKEQKKFCWFTQFQFTDTRRAFPCLDEPALKAPFDITIRGREGWQTLSNMPLQETVPLGGGEFLDRFRTTIPMSPYLVAFAISDYVGVKLDDHNMTIWAPKRDIDDGKAVYAKRVGVKLFTYFKSYLNVPYSLPKIDLIVVPEKAGAMENWGLATFGPAHLGLTAVNITPTYYYWGTANIIAHELAHQWFGNLVTCFWWSQLWLNEGFAVYLSYLAEAHVLPNSHAWGRFLLEHTQNAFRKDHYDLKTVPSLSSNVESRFVSHEKVEISYSKGGSFLRMVESVVTTASFAKSLTAYLNKHSFDKVTEDDLFYHLQAAAKEDGNWPVGNSSKELFYILKDWTNKKGVPLVTVDRDWNNNGKTATLNQTMYVTIGEPMDTKWDIPITYWTPGGSHDSWKITTPKIWLNKEMDNVTIKDLSPNLPLVVNVQATGYYRVNYDDKSWRMIGDTLAKSHKAIHPLNRVQIICDVLSLSGNGFISEEIKQRVFEYKDKEDDYAARKAFTKCDWSQMMDLEYAPLYKI